MRSKFFRTLGPIALALLAVATGAYAVDYGPYHQFSEVQSQLQSWAAKPEVELITIGQSAGGRPIYVVRVAAAGADAESQPAVFVGANMSGDHNSGTEAALDLIETLLAGSSRSLLQSRTFYIAPVLNPDAHDALFAKVRVRRQGDARKLDHDSDGLLAEDDFNDLDGNGRITAMRIPDASGSWLPLQSDPRIMVRSDSLKQRAGAYRMEKEGVDDDGDGRFNEDTTEGVTPDMNFPHAFPFPEIAAGPFPGYAPEAKALTEFLFAHRNVALAVIYGPANNLLELPRSLGGGGDLGSLKFKVPPQFAEMMGFDPEAEYTIDEIWEVAKELPFIKQNDITKEQVAQFLGAGPATKLEDEDQKLFQNLADSYKERLKKAGLDTDRPVEQYSKGGVTPWLYYQYAVPALELDVWGIPKAREEKKNGEKEALTVDSLEKMSSEDFLALGQDRITAFLKEIKAPPQFSASMVMERVKSGQVTPKMMAGMIRQMGGGNGGGEAEAGEEDAATKRAKDVLAWVDANAADAFTAWKTVTLPDGTKAEVGGLDPFIRVAPPLDVLRPALAAHTAEVLDLASKMARVEIRSLETEDLGGGIYRVTAVAANRGFLPTHSKMAVRAHALLPIRMTIHTGNGVELVTGHDTVSSERLEGTSGTLEGSWLIRAPKGANVTVELLSQNAGTDRKTTTVGKGA